MRALLLCLPLAACAAGAVLASNDDHGPPNYLVSTSWVRVNTDTANPPTIEFHDTGASGFAGCNRWFAQVAHDGEKLTFSDIGSTRMACPEPAMTAERDFLAALGRTRYGHYDRDALVLLDEAQQQIARFERPR